MKTLNPILVLIILLSIGNFSFGQKDLSIYSDIDAVFVKSYWGNINVVGIDASNQDIFDLEAVYTDTSKKSKNLGQLSDYVSFKVENRKLYIETREPKGFESIDLNLKMPADLFLEIKLEKGGNIFADNMKNGVEINILNGSVNLERIGKYALVNAANGEIVANFDTLDEGMPISLVTMNGGVNATLPDNSKRDLRLISRKNGFVLSDFDLLSDEKIINLNVRQYSKKPIINTARINGGGALLFLSTENGPISIKKNRS